LIIIKTKTNNIYIINYYLLRTISDFEDKFIYIFFLYLLNVHYFFEFICRFKDFKILKNVWYKIYDVYMFI